VKIDKLSPLQEYEEVHLRALLKVGIFLGVPAFAISLYYWRMVWPYAITAIGILVWAAAVDRVIDRLRDK
jgi:hypothetical protein